MIWLVMVQGSPPNRYLSARDGGQVGDDFGLRGHGGGWVLTPLLPSL